MSLISEQRYGLDVKWNTTHHITVGTPTNITYYAHPTSDRTWDRKYNTLEEAINALIVTKETLNVKTYWIRERDGTYSSKIDIIKALRCHGKFAQLGLKEAKELVDEWCADRNVMSITVYSPANP